MDRLLRELLTNACKFTPARETIAIAASARMGWIQIKVTNSGVYIPPNELNCIFDKFYRVPNSDPWKYQGTGLGLALAKQLVVALGGSIWAESRSDWTSFVVELPYQENQEITKADLLMSYVAYYVSRGKQVISPFHGALPFEGLVYQYSGYHRDFCTFGSSYDSDTTSKNYTSRGMSIDSASRCQKAARLKNVRAAICQFLLPIKASITWLALVPPINQPCRSGKSLEVTNVEPAFTRIAVIGTPATNSNLLGEWLSLNGFEIAFLWTLRIFDRRCSLTLLI